MEEERYVVHINLDLVQVFIGSYSASAAFTTASLHLDSTVTEGLVTITMSGPGDKWFAVAFGSPDFAMSDKPWTVVVDGK